MGKGTRYKECFAGPASLPVPGILVGSFGESTFSPAVFMVERTKSPGVPIVAQKAPIDTVPVGPNDLWVQCEVALQVGGPCVGVLGRLYGHRGGLGLGLALALLPKALLNSTVCGGWHTSSRATVMVPVPCDQSAPVTRSVVQGFC